MDFIDWRRRAGSQDLVGSRDLVGGRLPVLSALVGVAYSSVVALLLLGLRVFDHPADTESG